MYTPLQSLLKKKLNSRLGLICLGGILVSGVVLGFLLGADVFSREMLEKRSLEKKDHQQKMQLQSLRLELARVQSTAEIDKASLQQVQKSLSSLQAKLAAADEELWLYRHLLQDKADSEGNFGSTLKLVSESPLGKVKYKLLLFLKSNKKGRPVNVSYLVTLKGEKGGEQASFSIHDPDENVGARRATFKYFYVEEGGFQLPEEFFPSTFEVKVWKEKKATEITTVVIPWNMVSKEQ